MDTGRPLGVAVAQTEPVIGDVGTNLRLIREAVHAAAGQGIQLVVLPELCTTGYVFHDRAEALEFAEPLTGPTVRELCDLAADEQVHLVAGVAERAGADLFNSAVLIGPTGLIGTYRKVHLWDNENTIFAPGDGGLPVFKTELGRIGMLICYDLWFPEATRALALRGAELICLPTNWVPIPGQRDGAPAMATTLCQAAAHVNGVFVLAADRVGIERGQPFVGQSAIVGPTGWPETEIADADEPQLLTAWIDVDDAVASRQWNTFNDPLANRRPDVYDHR